MISTVSTQDKNGRQRRQHVVYVASLIAANNTGYPPGEVIKKDESFTLIRHGLYTYGIYSPNGGWVIISLIRKAINEIIATILNAGKILAAATMEQQWMVQKDKTHETAALLARMITPHIPAYNTMPMIRKEEITREIEQLCSIFIQREKKYTHFQSDAVPFDQRTIDYAKDDSFDGIDENNLNYKSCRQNVENKQVQEKLLDLLSYYWESIFIIWWKGFW